MCFQDSMKVVVDTNVFVSALTSSIGSNRRVLQACFENAIKPVMGSALFHEMESVMQRPSLLKRCPLSAKERILFFSSYLSTCEWVNIHFLRRPNLKD
ncbi:MAG: putative toxin-antitoxin system toxin component, PIN family [Kiritimatiellia bacterium]